MAPQNARQRVLSVLEGTEGTQPPDWSVIETAANSQYLLYDPTFTAEISRFQRQPVRPQIGTLASIPGRRQATISLTTELKGSGVAGQAPDIGPLLKACGMTETINTGTASVGTPNPDPKNRGSSLPTFGGTYTGALSGLLVVTVADVTTDTSITVNSIFYPSDGSAATPDGPDTQNSATEITFANAVGVTLDFGDPSVSTSGYEEGDVYYVPITSDQQVDVQYTLLDPSNANPGSIVDMSLNQDGRALRMYSCRGSFEINANIDEIATITFNMTGIPVAPADVSLITSIDFDDVVPPPFINISNVDILGSTNCINSLNVNQGNVVTMRSCAQAEFGNESARITGREVTGSVDPEADLVAAFNTYGALYNGAEAAFDWQSGSQSGNIVQIQAPRVQITDIGDESRDDILVDNLSLQFNQPIFSPSGEYSGFTLTFK